MHMIGALTYKQCNLFRGMEMKMIKEKVIGACGELGRNKLFLFGAFCVVDVTIARLHSCYSS